MLPAPAIWPLTDIVIFDCDSTLASIEGIDELARLTGSASAIAALTQRAMDGAVPLESVYSQRLHIAQPTQAQVQYLRNLYRAHVVPDAPALVTALQALGCRVFIVSGGLFEPVKEFAEWLDIPVENVYAVAMEYDQLAGQWWRYWEQDGEHNPDANYLAVSDSPLTRNLGKNEIIARLRRQHPGRAMLIGDGASDLEAAPEVDLFVGFGGVVRRAKVAAESPIYIEALSLAPILPLALGRLGNVAPWNELFAAGMQAIQNGQVNFAQPYELSQFLNTLNVVNNAAELTQGHPFLDLTYSFD